MSVLLCQTYGKHIGEIKHDVGFPYSAKETYAFDFVCEGTLARPPLIDLGEVVVEIE